MLDWLWSRSVAAAPDIEARARELLLDTIGCAIAGVAEPELAALFRLAASADPGTIRFPGVPQAVSSAAFSYGFAAAACWHEACEGLAVAHGRPGLHAISAVLGPALARGDTLGALLDAIVAGYETGGRLGMVSRIRPGMHVDGTWGSFAAAAAACRLAGDTPGQALAALDHVACHMPFSLYRPIAAGSTARNAYAGHGAAHGAASALASRAGMGGPPGSIAEMARLALGIETLPSIPGPGRWLLLEGYLKPYPAVRHVHYAAAAAEQWHETSPLAITAITLRTYAEALTYCGNRAPATAIQAQFSVSYGTAIGLAHGRLDPKAYSQSSLADPLVQRLEAMIDLQVDPALTAANRRGCTLKVRADGGVWTRTVDTVPGDPATPMLRAAVRDKFLAYAGPIVGAAPAQALAQRILEGGLDVPISLV